MKNSDYSGTKCVTDLISCPKSGILFPALSRKGGDGRHVRRQKRDTWKTRRALAEADTLSGHGAGPPPHRQISRKAQEREAILKAVSHGSKSIAEIAETLGIDRNGHLGGHLDELALAGFVARDIAINPRTGQPARTVRYRLKDNYSRFWLHYVEPFAREIEDGLFKYDSLDSLKGWDSIKGLQFENLVVSNYRYLLPALGIAGASLVSAAPYRRNATVAVPGLQIDLLLQTKTTAYVVEIKRRREIGSEVAGEIKSKMAAAGFKSRIAVRSVLVYEGRLAPSVISGHLVDFAIPAASLFDAPAIV